MKPNRRRTKRRWNPVKEEQNEDEEKKETQEDEETQNEEIELKGIW